MKDILFESDSIGGFKRGSFWKEERGGRQDMWHGLIGFFTGTTLGRYLATVLVIIIFLTIWPTAPGDVLDFVWRRVSFAFGHMFEKGQVLFQWVAAGFALYLWSLGFDKTKSKGGGGGGHS